MIGIVTDKLVTPGLNTSVPLVPVKSDPATAVPFTVVKPSVPWPLLPASRTTFNVTLPALSKTVTAPAASCTTP